MTTVVQEREVLNLGWTRGDSVSFVLRFVGLAGAAGYEWTAEIRTGPSRWYPLLTAFAVFAVVDGADAVVSLSLVPAESEKVPGLAYYDLQSDDGGSGVRTWVGGRVLVTADVTVPTEPEVALV